MISIISIILNIIIGIVSLCGIGYNIIRTKVLTENHIAHLAIGQQKISDKLDSIDKNQQTQSTVIAGILARCEERGKCSSQKRKGKVVKGKRNPK